MNTQIKIGVVVENSDKILLIKKKIGRFGIW